MWEATVILKGRGIRLALCLAERPLSDAEQRRNVFVFCLAVAMWVPAGHAQSEFRLASSPVQFCFAVLHISYPCGGMCDTSLARGVSFGGQCFLGRFYLLCFVNTEVAVAWFSPSD